MTDSRGTGVIGGALVLALAGCANGGMTAVTTDYARDCALTSVGGLNFGGANSYVDLSSLARPDGRRYLYAMRGGAGIYSFVSSDWRTFAQEVGARVLRTAWIEFPVSGLFDPTVIRLPDGRYRMYVTAQLVGRQALVSATFVPRPRGD